MSPFIPTTTPAEAGVQFGDADGEGLREIAGGLPTGPWPPPGWWRGGGAVLLLAFTSAAALADTPLPPQPLAYTQLPDPAQEAKAKALMETLRCVVCQGQSIADSDADMAGSMRALVRRRIAAGESPGSIRAWLIGRYGAYVTYDPPLSAVTWPLWLAAPALLVAGAWLARGSLRRRSR